MMNLLKNALTFLYVIASVSLLNGQVWFKLDLLEDKETYQLSLISDENWNLPQNITSTGQISIKAPANKLTITDVKNLNPNLEWEFNSRLNSPPHNPDYDYFSFGLKKSSRTFNYKAGEEIPLISFKNEKGCIDFVEIVDNDADEYAKAKNKTVNVGNQLTVLGAKGNAYVGIKGNRAVRCKTAVSTSSQDIKPKK